VAYCRKQGRNESTFQQWNRDSKPKLEINYHNKRFTQILIWTDDDLVKSAAGSGAESEKIHNMRVIENFETVLESINMPSSDQQFRSYDYCKLGVLLKIISGQIKLCGQVWTLRPHP
jgi:hypothetical protein